MFRFCLFFFLSILFLSSSCKKEEKEYPTYYMDQEFKDYVVFPVGSYWVYEVETSGEIDSVYLYKINRGINDSRKIVGYNYEYINSDLFSSYYNDTLLGSVNAELMGQPKPYCTYSESYLNNSLNYSYYYFNSTTQGDILPIDNNLLYKEYFNNFSINNDSYTSVKYFQCITQKFSSQAENIYYSRYVGLIRKELFNGQVWNLKRYHIAS